MKEAPKAYRREDLARGNEGTEGPYPTPAPLPSDVMHTSPAEKGQDERALCLRVLAAVLGEQAAHARVEQALALAQEVYELELEDGSVGEYP
jgi:hypothetical protein